MCVFDVDLEAVGAGLGMKEFSDLPDVRLRKEENEALLISQIFCQNGNAGCPILFCSLEADIKDWSENLLILMTDPLLVCIVPGIKKESIS